MAVGIQVVRRHGRKLRLRLVCTGVGRTGSAGNLVRRRLRSLLHNPAMQRTGAAGIVSVIRALLGRGSGR